MYSRANLYQAYHQEGIMTASPIELIVMLYDALVKNLKLARIYIESKSIEKAGHELMKAQDVLQELMRSLDMNYEIAKQLMNIYDYILLEIVKINLSKDAQNIGSLIEMLDELKGAWKTIKVGTVLSYAREE